MDMDQKKLHQGLLKVFKNEGKYTGDLETARLGISTTMRSLRLKKITFPRAANDVLTDLIAFESILRNKARGKIALDGRKILPPKKYHELWWSKKENIGSLTNNLIEFVKNKA